MKKADLYYTAGLLDGEGTISLIRANKRKMRSPYVSVSSTTPELLEYLKEAFGGTIVGQKTYKKHHKKAQMWRLTYNGAYEFIKKVGPLLREPSKRQRAELIIKEYKNVTPRNGKYTEQQLIEREIFEEKFFKL